MIIPNLDDLTKILSTGFVLLLIKYAIDAAKYIGGWIKNRGKEKVSKNVEKRRQDKDEWESLFDNLTEQIDSIKTDCKDAKDERAALDKEFRLYKEQTKKSQEIFESKIREMETENRKNTVVLAQIERSEMSLLTECGIASWNADAAGHFLTGNIMFAEITGLDIENCKNFVWLSAVEEGDRERVGRLWREFTRNAQTHTRFQFNFKHLKTGTLTKVTVGVQTIYELDAKVYKYMARTKPLFGADTDGFSAAPPRRRRKTGEQRIDECK